MIKIKKENLFITKLNLKCKNDAGNDWVEDFFEKLAQGNTVYEACIELNQLSKYRTNGLNGFVIYGNSELTFS